MTTLAEAIEAGPVVLDGGLATQLEATGHDISGALWSARLLLDDPDAVVAAHTAFFDAGAQVATSATYQASVEGFARLGLDRRRAAAVLASGVHLATRARDEAVERDGRERWVAASVGPYGAMLADGSEYRGDYGMTVEALRRWHRPRLEVLADALDGVGGGVLACETVPAMAEVEALLTELSDLDTPAWVSVSAPGLVAQAADAANDVACVVAVGVNCCDPAAVTSALLAVTDRPGIAYPNSGQTWDAGARAWVGPSHLDAGAVTSWVDAGARLVGGCCRVSPADIAAMAAVLTP